MDVRAGGGEKNIPSKYSQKERADLYSINTNKLGILLHIKTRCQEFNE